MQVKPEQLNYGIVTQKRPHNLPNQVVKEQSDQHRSLESGANYTLKLFTVNEKTPFFV
jgi:hypothetical protein